MAGRGIGPTPSPARPQRFHARVVELSDPAWAREYPEPIRSGRPDVEGGVGIPQPYAVRLERVPDPATALLRERVGGVGGGATSLLAEAGKEGARGEVLIHATLEQYGRFLPGLHRESHELDQIADAVDAALRNYASPHRRTIRGLHRPFAVGEKTLVMGVVNVTPDSFSDGGRFLDPDRAIERGLKLAEEGADLVDVGGESTRPGASEVTPEAEWARIGPVLARLHGELKVPISVDTRHAAVAENALDAGADLVNDVGGLRDPEMRHLLARTGAPAVLMHMRGTPSTMQANLDYADVRAEVYGSLSDATEAAIAEGVESDRLLIDPGLGFGKSAAQNLELLAHLGEFRSMGFPIVVGASRKSFLGWALGNVPVEQRLEAGLAAAVVAAGEGADIVRTHDVAPTVRALTLVDSVRRPRPAEGRPGASPTRPRGATSNPSRVG